MPRTIRLLGLDFADLNLAQTAAWLSQRPPADPFGYVVTPNADHLVRLNRQSGLAMLYDDVMLRLLDSRVVEKLARLLGLPVPPVTPGSDLTELLLRYHLRPGDKITIVGLHPQHLPAIPNNTPAAVCSALNSLALALAVPCPSTSQESFSLSGTLGVDTSLTCGARAVPVMATPASTLSLAPKPAEPIVVGVLRSARIFRPGLSSSPLKLRMPRVMLSFCPYAL